MTRATPFEVAAAILNTAPEAELLGTRGEPLIVKQILRHCHGIPVLHCISIRSLRPTIYGVVLVRVAEVKVVPVWLCALLSRAVAHQRYVATVESARPPVMTAAFEVKVELPLCAAAVVLEKHNIVSRFLVAVMFRIFLFDIFLEGKVERFFAYERRRLERFVGRRRRADRSDIL